MRQDAGNQIACCGVRAGNPQGSVRFAQGSGSRVSLRAGSPPVAGSRCRSGRFARKIPAKRRLGRFIHKRSWEHGLRQHGGRRAYLCEGLWSRGARLGWRTLTAPGEWFLLQSLLAYFSMCWKELSNQLKMFHGLGKRVAATVYQEPTVMTQKHREAFNSKFPLAIEIFTESPGVLSESGLLK